MLMEKEVIVGYTRTLIKCSMYGAFWTGPGVG